MAFAKKTLDGVAAWKRALASGTARPGYCLAEVHEAFGAPASDRVFPYANATEARVRARQLKAIKGTDLDAAPEGSVLYWSNVIVKGRDLGHIAFKGPKNTIITIDNPTRGRWGQVTVAAFRKKWSWLKFEGYAYGPGAYLGHTVTVATDLKPVPAPGKPAGTIPAPLPLLREGNDMLLIHKIVRGVARYALVGSSFWVEFSNSEVQKGEPANSFVKQVGGNSVEVSEDFWNDFKAEARR